LEHLSATRLAGFGILYGSRTSQVGVRLAQVNALSGTILGVRMKPKTHCKQGHPLRHEDGTLTANAHRRRDGRGVECQTCKHGKVPRAALRRTWGVPVKPQRRRQTPTERRQAAEREAKRQAERAEAEAKGLVVIDEGLFTLVVSPEWTERQGKLRIVEPRQ